MFFFLFLHCREQKSFRLLHRHTQSTRTLASVRATLLALPTFSHISSAACTLSLQAAACLFCSGEGNLVYFFFTSSPEMLLSATVMKFLEFPFTYKEKQSFVKAKCSCYYNGFVVASLRLMCHYYCFHFSIRNSRSHTATTFTMINWNKHFRLLWWWYYHLRQAGDVFFNPSPFLVWFVGSSAGLHRKTAEHISTTLGWRTGLL